MNFETFKKDKGLIALAIMSIAIFPSLFLSPKILGIVFLLYVITIAYNIYKQMGGNILSRLSDDSWERMKEAKSEKKYFTASIYLIVFPMVIIGIIMLFCKYML